MNLIIEKIKTLKKHRFTVIAALALLVAFSCALVFVGNSNGESAVSFAESVAEMQSSVKTGDAIFVDGNLIAAFASEEEANAVLESVLADRVSALGIDENALNSFNNNVTVVNGEYPNEAFVGKDAAISLLSDDVSNYNGESLSVKLSVRSVVTLNENVVIEHGSKTVYTNGLRDGVKKVVSKGYNGEGNETYQLVSVDGVVTERVSVSMEVITEATDEVVRIGTCSNGKDTATLGTFIKPYDGIVTSYMGPRWGRTHNGIDISQSGCHGDPAYAAADGVVVRADWYGGYGNCVIVDHGNGVQTLYAHFSKISVSVGDYVSAGDEVGKIGSTGNSTGPHLHFEVHVDGEIVNPLIFVNYK